MRKKSQKSASEKKEDSKTRKKSKKILEELNGTKNISKVKSAKKRILIPKVKNMKGEIITTRKGIATVFAKFHAKLYEDDEGEDEKEEKEAETCTEKKDAYSIRTYPSSRQVKFKMPSIASREVKQVTALECELNSSKKIAVTGRKKRSGTSSTKSCCNKTCTPRESESRSTTKEAEKMRAVTGRFAACFFYTNYSLQYYTNDSPTTRSGWFSP